MGKACCQREGNSTIYAIFVTSHMNIFLSLFLAPTLEFSRESGFAEFATKIPKICGKGNISY